MHVEGKREVQEVLREDIREEYEQVKRGRR